MSLHDYYSEGKWLTEGWHDVRVDSVKSITADTGTEGVEFSVVNEDSGAGRGATFWLTEKALRRLAGFAKACGLSEDEMKRYDELSMVSHRTLINRRLKVLVEKGEKYHEVVDWAALGSDTPASVATPPPPAETMATGAADGIPF